MKNKMMKKPEVVELSVLKELEQLNEAGQSDIVVDMIESFLQSAPQYMDAIMMAFSNEDLEGVAKQAHAMKSTAKALGAQPLAGLCEDAEKMKDQKDLAWGNQIEMVATLKYLHEKTCRELSQIRSERED